MKTDIYVNDVHHDLVGRDLYLYRQQHACDGQTMEQQELMQKKKRGVGREGWLTDILKKAYG